MVFTKTNKTFKLLFILYAIVVFWGLKQYSIWNQITDVFNENTNVDSIMLLNSFNAHTLRLLLMLPIIKIANSLRIDSDFLFSIVVFLNILGTSKNLIYIEAKIDNKKPNYFFISLFMILISLVMNGRTSFSFLGISIILKIITEFTIKSISLFKLLIYLIIGLILCSVSSGSFSVALLSVVIFLSSLFFKKTVPFKNKLILFILIIIISIPVVALMVIFVNKNLEFYDNSYINMLNHGAGMIFNNSIILLTLLIFAPLFFLIFISISRFYMKDIKVYLFMPFILSGILIGLFGFTSFWTSYPVYILTFLSVISKKVDIKSEVEYLK